MLALELYHRMKSTVLLKGRALKPPHGISRRPRTERNPVLSDLRSTNGSLGDSWPLNAAARTDAIWDIIARLGTRHEPVPRLKVFLLSGYFVQLNCLR